MTRSGRAFSASVLTGALVVLLAGCGEKAAGPAARPAADLSSWEGIEKAARGSDVVLMMWQGDPYINRYIQNFVVPAVKQRHGVNLRVTAGQGAQVVTTLMTEAEAKKTTSSFDLAWINGETFYQLRQVNGLYGPFTDKLPNARYIDFDNRFIGYDFQQEVNGYEAP
ncbi:MAG: hypothetical protein ABIS29_17975, partial [Vicinamibacterales bacterium]